MERVFEKEECFLLKFFRSNKRMKSLSDDMSIERLYSKETGHLKAGSFNQSKEGLGGEILSLRTRSANFKPFPKWITREALPSRSYTYNYRIMGYNPDSLLHFLEEPPREPSR